MPYLTVKLCRTECITCDAPQALFQMSCLLSTFTFWQIQVMVETKLNRDSLTILRARALTPMNSAASWRLPNTSQKTPHGNSWVGQEVLDIFATSLTMSRDPNQKLDCPYVPLLIIVSLLPTRSASTLYGQDLQHPSQPVWIAGEKIVNAKG